MQISREIFDQQRRPRFGTANPERMQFEFWEWMIRGDETPPSGEGGVLEKYGLSMQNGILKSGYGPCRARKFFDIPSSREDGPIWTFERYGQTRTELPDGRVVCIGGEHEDSYDPDFCIYNDVVVLNPDGGIEIYGYPKDIFPPTDFHTTTVFGDQLFIVGCLGYPEDRCLGHTPVHSLDLSSYRISEVATTGELPGWLFRHNATVDAEGVITVTGGEHFVKRDNRDRIRKNTEDYSLDTRSWVWHRVTNNNWRQISIRKQDNGWFPFESGAVLEHAKLITEDSDYVKMLGVSSENYRQGYFLVSNALVSVTIDLFAVEILVMNELAAEITGRFVEGVRANVESILKIPCVSEDV